MSLLLIVRWSTVRPMHTAKPAPAPKRPRASKTAPAPKGERRGPGRPPAPVGTEVVGVRLDRDTIRDVDARVAALNASGDVPSRVTRTGLLTHVIRQAVAEWKRESTS